MQTSNFVIYKNTKFTDMQNTVHFSSNARRDKFFDKLSPQKTFESPFNFRRDRGLVRVPCQMDDLQGYNYGRFVNGFDGKTYYFFIAGMTYLNDTVTQLEIVIDVIMTYTQGSVLNNIKGVEVQRRHLSTSEHKQYQEYLSSNNDILPVSTLKYSKDVDIVWEDFSVIVESSVYLDGDYGDENAPKMNTAAGVQIDKCQGATALYCFTYGEFTSKMDELSKYPWIAQNIKSAKLIPTEFTNSLSIASDKRIEGGNSFQPSIKDLNFTIKDIRSLLSLHPEGSEDYLIHDGLLTIELTDYRNHKLIIKPSTLRDNNEFGCVSIVGYDNVFEIYRLYDNARQGTSSTGTYLDNVLRIDNFDNMPMLINNTVLNKANTAYQREVQQQQTITGKINTLTDKNSSVQDKLYSAFSIYSDVFSGGITGSIGKAAGLFKNEYEYYRDLKAQYKQWEITPPTVTDGSYGSAILRKQNQWGVHLKFATPHSSEINKMKRYYGAYGFDVQNIVNDTGTVDSMPICNWLQFTGQWLIDDVDANFMTQLQTIFEAGVRFFTSYEYLNNVDYLDNNPTNFETKVIFPQLYGSDYGVTILKSGDKFTLFDTGCDMAKHYEGAQKLKQMLDDLGCYELENVIISHWDDDHYIMLMDGLLDYVHIKNFIAPQYDYNTIKNYKGDPQNNGSYYNTVNSRYTMIMNALNDSKRDVKVRLLTDSTYDFPCTVFNGRQRIDIIWNPTSDNEKNTYWNMNCDSLMAVVRDGNTAVALLGDSSSTDYARGWNGSKDYINQITALGDIHFNLYQDPHHGVEHQPRYFDSNKPYMFALTDKFGADNIVITGTQARLQANGTSKESISEHYGNKPTYVQGDGTITFTSTDHGSWVIQN